MDARTLLGLPTDSDEDSVTQREVISGMAWGGDRRGGYRVLVVGFYAMRREGEGRLKSGMREKNRINFSFEG